LTVPDDLLPAERECEQETRAAQQQKADVN
jgi:hypothetical protein